MKNVYVMVAVPNNGTWRDETAKSMALMFSYFALRALPGVATQKLGMMSMQGSMIAQQRHTMAQKACADPNVTHVLFIDTDMMFHKDLVHRLFVHDKDIVACNCTTRAHPVVPVSFGFDDERIDSRKNVGLQKVRQVGMAVALIKVDVFRKLKPPFFLQDWVPDMKAYCGEDVYFCQKVLAAGYDVWVDHSTSLSIKHVGSRAYGHDDIDPAMMETVTKEVGTKEAA